MTLKPVRVLVQWKDGTTRRLNTIEESDDPVTAKQVSILEKIYPDLWKLYLFVSPELRSRGFRIRERFQEALKEEAHLSATCDPAFENYLETGCMDYRIGRKLDKELYAAPAFNVLPYERKISVLERCHAKLPPDSFDEDSTDLEIASRLESQALREQLRGIVDAILKEDAGAASGEPPELSSH
jgi:hypothetical protein